MAKQLQLTFRKRETITADTYLFIFTPSQKFEYAAGQYLQITIKHKDVDDKGSSRFFTISSAPHESEIIVVTTVSQSSFKKALFALQKGDTVTAFGPIGTFVLSELKS